METINILAIIGSLRKESYNRKLVDNLSTLSPSNFNFIKFPLEKLPLMNEDLETNLPKSVKDLRDEARNSHLILFASPEYNNTFSSITKNAIEWLSRDYENDPSPLVDKPAVLTGTSPSSFGTSRAQHDLRSLLSTTGMHLIYRHPLHIPNAKEAFTENILTDKNTLDRIENLFSVINKFLKNHE